MGASLLSCNLESEVIDQFLRSSHVRSQTRSTIQRIEEPPRLRPWLSSATERN